MSTTVAERLEAISAEFEELAPRERLELLLEFSEKLAPLPADLAAERDAGINRVPECQTPVFLWVRIEDGHVRILADVAPEAPTVKGFVSVLVDLFHGATPQEIMDVETNLVHRLGLIDALGMVRMRGLSAIAHHIKQRVAKAALA